MAANAAAGNGDSAIVLDVIPLRNEFVDAVTACASYDLRDEPFFPQDPTGRVAPDFRKSTGTVVITDTFSKLAAIRIAARTPYAFRYIEREISPLRTPRGRYADGDLASKSGAGGVDYVGVVDADGDRPCIPVLGEIKRGGDKDTFYAFLQLLTYLSEIASAPQTARASRFLFQGRLPPRTRWDLHVLLADFNPRSAAEPLIESTRRLVTSFKAALASSSDHAAILGRVSCLHMNTATFDGELALAWEV